MAKQTFTTGQVLTAAQVNALQANDFNQTVSVKTANYVLAAADKGTRIEFNTSGSVTCTVNSGLFDAGDTLVIQNRGSGTATVTAGTATVNSSASLAVTQYSAGILYFISDSAALFFGDAAGISATAFDAKGDLLVGTGSDTFTRLPVSSTNGWSIVADSAETTGLKWQAAASGGGLTLISDTQASSNSSITFSSLGSYKQLILTWYGVKHSTGGSKFSLRLNNDSTASIYEGRGTSASDATFRTVGTDVDSLSPVGDVQYFMFGEGATSGGKEASQGYVIIDNYTSTTRFKTLLCKFSYYDIDASPDKSREADLMMYYRSTNAVTSLDIVRLSGSATLTNDASTSIRLYGLS